MFLMLSGGVNVQTYNSDSIYLIDICDVPTVYLALRMRFFSSGRQLASFLQINSAHLPVHAGTVMSHMID